MQVWWENESSRAGILGFSSFQLAKDLAKRGRNNWKEKKYEEDLFSPQVPRFQLQPGMDPQECEFTGNVFAFLDRLLSTFSLPKHEPATGSDYRYHVLGLR